MISFGGYNRNKGQDTAPAGKGIFFMKRAFAFFTAAIMLAALTGCAAGTGTAGGDDTAGTCNQELAGQTVTVSVTAIADGVYTAEILEAAAAENGGAPDGTAPSGETGTPPDMPDGTAPSGETGTPPDMPGGEAPSGSDEAPSMPAGGGAYTATGESITFVIPSGVTDEIEVAVNSILTLTFDGEGAVAAAALVETGAPGMSGEGGMGGTGSGTVSYDATNTYDTDTETSGIELISTGADENAVLVTDGATVTLDNVTIVRDSDDSTGGDNSSFYGVGAAALVTDGMLIISDSSITSDAAGGAGVFAYGDGTAYVYDTMISTVQGTSGGIHVAGGGTLYAWDLTVETGGASSAAIRSDRGSGTMVVNGGTYTSNGSGSPAIYSTADITVSGAVLTATGAEAVCIEGLNTIRLFDCTLSGDMPDDNAQNDCVWNVILYQSMSGDSEEGNSTFEMIGGSLTALNGGMFYTTNTESTFIISGVDITYAENNDFFLKCTGNSNARGWGSAGSNGADCCFTAVAQAMEGDVIWDSISRLDLYITDGSVLTGAVRDDESCAGDGGDGYAALYIDATGAWTVTGDSTVTRLYNAGTITDAAGSTASIIGTDGTVYVRGTSEYTVTVSEYSASVDLSGASAADSLSDYEVDRP